MSKTNSLIVPDILSSLYYHNFCSILTGL